MAWIPSEDPWGIGMLASAAMFVIASLVVNARRMAVRSRTGPVVVTGLAASAFLACAAMGTLERVAQAAPAAPQATEDSPANTAGAAPVGDAAAIDNDPSEATPPAPGALDEGSPTPAPRTAAVRNSGLEPVAAMPTADNERRAAVREVLRTARSTYEDEDDCKDAKAVGQAWAAVATIPQDSRSSRVDAVVRRLETCRRQIRWGIAYRVHRDRVSARDGFVDTLQKRLSETHGVTGSVVISGNDHERLRVGSAAFDETQASTIVTPALQDELAALGFDRIVLASAKQSWRTDLEPRTEASIVGDELVPFGLDDKLVLPPSG